jgi:hypothetical protein
LVVNPLGRVVPIVDEQGRATSTMGAFSDAVARLPVIIGTGTPEDAIEAIQGRFYMNEAGAPGSVLYIKQVAAISNDRKKGWVLIG